MSSLRLSFHLLIEYLMFLPFFLIGGILMSHHYSLPVWLVSFILVYVLGVLFKTLVQTDKWWIYALCAGVTSVPLAFLIGDHWVTWLILIIVYPIISYRGIRHMTTDIKTLLPIPILWVGGFITYFVAYLFFRYLDSLVDYLPLITVGGIVFVIATLFLSNSEQLKRSTLSKEKHPAINQTIRRQNKIYLSLTIVVILILSIGNYIQNGLLQALRWLFGLMGGDGKVTEVPVETPPQSSESPDLGLGEITEPSLFWKILEQIAIYAVYITLAIVAILLILLLVKKTRVGVIKLFHAVMAFLKTMSGRFTDDTENELYEEEKENIFNFKDWSDEQKQRMKSLASKVFKRKVNWNTLSNREKVRVTYRTFISEQSELKNESDTPREIVAKITHKPEFSQAKLNDLLTAYEAVRYGDQDVTDQQVEAIHHLIEK